MKKLSNFRFSYKGITLFFVSFFVLLAALIIAFSNIEQTEVLETVHENQIQIGDRSLIMPHLKGFSSAEQIGMKDYIKSISVSKHHWPTIYTITIICKALTVYQSIHCQSSLGLK